VSFLVCIVACCAHFATAKTIELPECDPPDYPQWGGYGPRQEFYVVGDIIHYYCDTDTYIGGNFYRRCEDTGDWLGDTPVCDSPTEFSLVNQTSTANPENENVADLVTDGLRSTCSSTLEGTGAYWMGILSTPGELIRVMLFMPRVHVAYDVLLLKKNGHELSCGTRIANNDRLGWEFHNCPGPNNTDAIGIKIKSLSSDPLQICEIAAHVLTPPTCVDPHLHIDNGRVQLTRKTASLVCEYGYTRSPLSRIECVRNGVWNRKSLYCLEKQWEVGGGKESNNDDNEP